MLRWMLITALIIVFVVFLFYISSKDSDQPAPAPGDKPPTTDKADGGKPKVEAPPKPEGPQFHFYQYLPKKEKVVPDHEINTRAREEQVGKGKATHYILQAGAHKDAAEADRLRAQLALMGIESRLEKTKVGNVVWYRVTVGPYARMSSASAIRARLRSNGIDVVVTELSQ